MSHVRLWFYLVGTLLAFGAAGTVDYWWAHDEQVEAPRVEWAQQISEADYARFDKIVRADLDPRECYR